MDFGDYLYDRFGGKKPHYKINRIEKDYFKTLNNNMLIKSNKRIDNIKKRIINDVNKNSFNKKYQINSLIEYEIIKEFTKTSNIKEYELLYCGDNELTMNKLDKIIEGKYDCCRDCDRPMIFINKKIPVIYCYFYKD
jgi:hypothetical protein